MTQSVEQVTAQDKPKASSRPKFCYQMGDLGEAGCKRLPRHKGEHRGHLRAADERKALRADQPKAVKVTLKGLPKEAQEAIAAIIAQFTASPKGKVRTVKVGPKAQAKIEAARVQRPKAAKRRGNAYVTSSKPSARLA